MKAWEKTFWRVFGAALLLALTTWMHYNMPMVHAQAPGPSLVYANGPVNGCPPLPIPNGGALLCVGSDHVVFAPAAATKYLQLDSQTGAAVTLTINGTTKTLPASFTLSGNTVITAPAVTATAAAPSGSTVIAAQ